MQRKTSQLGGGGEKSGEKGCNALWGREYKKPRKEHHKPFPAGGSSDVRTGILRGAKHKKPEGSGQLGCKCAEKKGKTGKKKNQIQA